MVDFKFMLCSNRRMRSVTTPMLSFARPANGSVGGALLARVSGLRWDLLGLISLLALLIMGRGAGTG
jgi:hypothetical protein